MKIKITTSDKPEYITELVENCKLVFEESEKDGHDCWGNIEWITHKYVIINGVKKQVFDGWYVVHDGKKVKEATTKYIIDLNKELDEHEEKTGFRTPAEYAAYLKGLKDANNKK